jgi:hypothetical protein
MVTLQYQWQSLPEGKETPPMNHGPDDRDESYGPHHTEILDPRYGSTRHRHLAGLSVVAVLALAGGGGVAYVATHSGSPARTLASRGTTPSSTPSPYASGPSVHGRGPGEFGPFAGFGPLGGIGLGGLGGVVHGEATVPKPGGGYQTVDVQRGTVAAVSSSSITVNSADGYSATYVVESSTEVNAQAAGIGTVKTGDTVWLTATVSGGKATAASIIDLTSIRSSRGAFGFPPGPSDSDQP